MATMSEVGGETDGGASSATTFSFYDDLRTSPTATFRPVQQPKKLSSAGRALHIASDPAMLGQEPSSSETGESSVALCHVPIFLRYTMLDEATGKFLDVSSASYGGTAGALLAIHHFNNGDGTIVRELDGINERCNIRFTTEVIDTQSSPIVTVQSLTEMITKRKDTDIQAPQPCAVMGAAWYTISRSMATVTGVYDLLQVSPSSSSMSLDSMSQYPLFSRTHPSDEAKGLLAVEYFEKVFKIKNFGVLFVNSDQGISLQKTILDTATRRNMTVRSVAFEEDSNAESMRNSLLQLKRSGFNYFIGVLFPLSYDYVLKIAKDVGVAGSGKYWLVTGHLAETFAAGNTTITKGSSAAKGSKGMGVLHDDGEYGLPHYDNFAKHWRKIGRNREALDYINSKQPSPPEDAPDISFSRSGDYFLDMRPSHYSQYSFDAIAGMGIAACQAEKKSNLPDSFFTGKDHHARFISHSFDGATGKVAFANASFSRDGMSTNYFLSEINEVAALQNSSVFTGTTRMYFDTKRLRWERFPGASRYVYSDGTQIPPAELPPYVENTHGLTSPVQVVCIFLAAVAILSSVGLMGFVYRYRTNEIIVASQPPFLYMLCVGTLVMASAIVPMAIDDSVTDAAGCSIACMSKIWLASIGFTITFSALFSKAWRINQLLKKSRGCQRVTVTPGDVIKPFLLLLSINILILALWTALAPLEWNRKALNYDSFGRRIESVGLCYSDGWLPFGIALFIVNFAALSLCVVEAYRGRNITTEFSESKYVAMAVVCIFQALLLGIPLLFLTIEWPTSQTFVLAAVVFIICMAVLLLIFIPKILHIRSGVTRASVYSQSDQVDTRRRLSIPLRRVSTNTGMVAASHAAISDDNAMHVLQQDLTRANTRISELEMQIEELKQPNSVVCPLNGTGATP